MQGNWSKYTMCYKNVIWDYCHNVTEPKVRHSWAGPEKLDKNLQKDTVSDRCTNCFQLKHSACQSRNTNRSQFYNKLSCKLKSMHTQVLLVSEKQSIENITSLVACIISMPKIFSYFFIWYCHILIMYVQETQELCYILYGNFNDKLMDGL